MSRRTDMLLHNMSVPSRTTINHTGAHVAPVAVFALPDDWPSGLAAVRRAFDAPDLDQAAAVALLDAHATELLLPPAAAVMAALPAGDAMPCADQRAVVTVLAKSSNHCYLARKAPLLDGVRPARRVGVLLPDGWSPPW